MPCCSLGRGSRLIRSVAVAAVFSFVGAALAFAQPTQTNLALKKPVVGSPGSNTPAKVVDGDHATYNIFNTSKTPTWFYVDLGGPTKLGRAFMAWSHRFSDLSSPESGKFFVSDDAMTWTQIWEGCDCLAQKEKNAFTVWNSTEVFFPPVIARYFKVELQSRGGAVPQAPILDEFELYDPESSTKNLALGKPATVSPGTGAIAKNATDGDVWSDTYFSSAKDSWVTVDLGAAVDVNRIRILSNHHGKITTFGFAHSTDNATWTKLYDIKPGLPAGSLYFASTVFPRVSARYIRMLMPIGGNVTEIYVYGPGSTVTDIPTLPPAPAAKVDGGATQKADAGVAMDAKAQAIDPMIPTPKADAGVISAGSGGSPGATPVLAGTGGAKGQGGAAAGPGPTERGAAGSEVPDEKADKAAGHSGCSVSSSPGSRRSSVGFVLLALCGLAIRLRRRSA